MASRAATDPEPHRQRRRLIRPPGAPLPLVLLLVATTVVGLMWALFVPPWQAPDERQHFAYAESLAERFALPANPRRLPANPHQLTVSSAQALADNAAGANRSKFYPTAVPPSWSASDFQRYKVAAGGHPSASDGGGPNTAYSNPPLYYLYSDIAYLASSGGNEFARLYAMRIWSVPLLLVTTLSAWLLAGEVFRRRRMAQLACASVTALMPMQTFISSAVNPDALMIALWGLALWLGTRIILRGGSRRDVYGLVLITAAAIVTKATSYALLPPVLLAMLLGWRRRPQSERAPAVSWFVPPLFVLAAPVVVWAFIASKTGRSPVNTVPQGKHSRPFSPTRFVSFVWQFYLPRLPGMKPDREVPGWPMYTYWIKQGWGIFGSLSVSMPDFVYRLLAFISLSITVPAAVLVARLRGRLRLELVSFYALALVCLLGLVHLTDYRSLIANQGPAVQGRYLLPLMPLFGLAVALILVRLPARWRGQACGVAVAGLILLQVLALASVAQGYFV